MTTTKHEPILAPVSVLRKGDKVHWDGRTAEVVTVEPYTQNGVECVEFILEWSGDLSAHAHVGTDLVLLDNRNRD